ncbi:MAG TPA: hypothetical protein VH475_27845 [Tepidisphaeraceae bacterium]|jgi:hypothetical protein
MFSFWFDLPPLLRILMGLVMVGIAVLIYFASGGTTFAIGLGVVGLVFVLASGAGSDKGGYNF